MSTTTSVGGSSVVQSLTQDILKQFDTNGDSQMSSAEFETFLQKLVSTLSGTALAATSGASTKSAAISAPVSTLAPSGLLSNGTAAAVTAAAQYECRGFDASRAQSAAGTLKYDAYNVLQGFNPADPTAMSRAFQALSAMHPGQYELDSEGNLMLTGTADGYIGARPNNRDSDWTNVNQPWSWQWMAYNPAHPGPSGEIS